MKVEVSDEWVVAMQAQARAEAAYREAEATFKAAKEALMVAADAMYAAQRACLPAWERMHADVLGQIVAESPEASLVDGFDEGWRHG